MADEITRSRLNAGRHHLTRDDRVSEEPDYVCVAFGVHLKVYLSGAKFWVSEEPSEGRQFPRLKAFQRACSFIEAINVTELVLPKCVWTPEDDEGLPLGESCGAPARWVGCVPYVRSPLCGYHKCRCAVLVGALNEETPVPPKCT